MLYYKIGMCQAPTLPSEISLLDYGNQHLCQLSHHPILSINCMFIALLEFNVCACNKPYFQVFGKIMKLICFSYFGYGFKIKTCIMHKNIMNNQEQVKNYMNNIQAYQDHSSIFK